MKRTCIFLLSITMLVACAFTAHAIEPDLKLYNMSISEALNENTDALAYIEDEILNQVGAVMKINNISSVKTLDSVDFSKAVKVAFVSSGNDMIEQIGSARDVIVRKDYVSTEDIFNSRFLDYYWKVPVLEFGDGYLFATVIINSPDDIIVSCIMAQNKELSDVTYLFDNELILNILGKSDLSVDYDNVIPVSIPIISTDIIIFVSEKVQYAIPFSARPDLLGVENGRVYEYEKLESLIDSLLVELSSGNASSNAPVGGGAAQVTDNNGATANDAASSYGLYFVIMAVFACVGVFLILYKKKPVRK